VNREARREALDPLDLYDIAGSLSEEERMVQGAVARLVDEKVLPEGDWQRHQMKSLLGEALLGLGRRVEAEPLIVEGYEGMKGNPAVPPDRLRQAEALVELLRTTH